MPLRPRRELVRFGELLSERMGVALLWLVSQTDPKIKKAISEALAVLKGCMGVADHGFVDTRRTPTPTGLGAEGPEPQEN